MREAGSLHHEYEHGRLICHRLGSCPMTIQLLGINALLDVWSGWVGVGGPMKGKRWRDQRGVLAWQLGKTKKIMGILSPICLLCPCLHSYQQSRASDIKTDEWQRRHFAPISSHIRSLNQKKMASHVWSKADHFISGFIFFFCFFFAVSCVDLPTWMCDFYLF